VGTIRYPQQRSGLIEDKGFGLTHIYYGQGVGKTTGAVGMAVRAAGADLKVDFVQFMKSGNSGEVTVFKNIPNIHYRCPGEHPFIMSHGPKLLHFKHAATALGYALEALHRGTHLLICDEILDTLIFELLRKNQLLELIERCKRKVELVMTV
jgi:cob(I)alamin adenosyltransferase